MAKTSTHAASRWKYLTALLRYCCQLMLYRWLITKYRFSGCTLLHSYTWLKSLELCHPVEIEYSFFNWWTEFLNEKLQMEETPKDVTGNRKWTLMSKASEDQDGQRWNGQPWKALQGRFVKIGKLNHNAAPLNLFIDRSRFLNNYRKT